MSSTGGHGLSGPGIGLATGAAGAVVFGWLASTTPGLPAVLVTAVLLLVVVCAALAVVDAGLLVYALTPRGRYRRRWRSAGYAGWREWWEHLAPRAVLAQAAQVRASLSNLPREQRRQLPTTEFAALAGHTVPGPVMPLPVWISYQDVVLLVAPPRQGKTAWMGGAIIDFPGPVVAASTKIDLYLRTARVRGGLGPVLAFNPRGHGGIECTVKWSPVAGAHDTNIADLHARAMVDGARDTAQRHAGGSNERFFEERASLLLRVYLMAAAVSGQGMHEVAGWTRNGNDQYPLRLIAQHRGQIPAGWEEELRQLLTTEAGKFRESVFFTVNVATSFASDPQVAEVINPGPRDGVFDVARFLDARATLYLIGRDSEGGGTIAPLFSAFTAHIHYHCVNLADANTDDAAGNDGRLDPPMMMALDEATQITPVPLPDWTSHAGSRGIFLIMVVQGLAKLDARWGADGGKDILQNSSVVLFFGGGKEIEAQRTISELVGYRDENVDRQHGKSGTGTRRVPVLDAADIRRIPRWHVLAIVRSAAPTIVKYQPVWTRKEVRAVGGQPPPPRGDDPDDPRHDPADPPVDPLGAGGGDQDQHFDPNPPTASTPTRVPSQRLR